MGIGIFGLAPASFPGGASLALTALGGGLAGYRAYRIDDFKREVNVCQMAVNTFNSEITQISEADCARGEVEALKRHAAAAKANVKQKSLDIETSGDFTER
ncbi:hypothetical protein EG329_014473 [Mollisiaceae sp. DMI_Dod_QoI]|nr:hypothetical protein EG329_014473 [Helotiales sp. DMI_Dod_QoI]